MKTYMKYDTKELVEILESHCMWLNGEGGKCADLSYTNLEGIDLKYANLRKANLQGAILTGANLNCATLEEAFLDGANLENAALYYTDFSNASLKNANLRGAHMFNTYLQLADMEGADIQNAYLHGDFRGTTLPEGVYQVSGICKGCITYDSINDILVYSCSFNSDELKGRTLRDFEECVEAVYGENGVEPDAKTYKQLMDVVAFFKARRK